MAACCPSVSAPSTPPKRPDTSLKGVLFPLIEEIEYAAALLDVIEDSDSDQIAIFRGLASDLAECQSINSTPEAYSYVHALLSLTQSLVRRLERLDPGQVAGDYAATICRVKLELEGAQASIEDIAPIALPEN